MLKVVETFSGIGSQAKALSKLGIDYKIVNTVEWDISAFYAYDIIHNGKQDLSPYEHCSKQEVLDILSKYSLSLNGKEPVKYSLLKSFPEVALKKILCAYNRTRNLGSITDINIDVMPKKIDLLTYSFPCQDLSICGSWHGNMSGIDRNAHNRSGLLWEVERLLKEIYNSKRRMPKFLLMENVKNILSKAHRSNFNEWKTILNNLGYVNKVYTLNASHFGSPQRRVRTFMISVYCPDNKRRLIAENYFQENDLEKSNPMPLQPLEKFLYTDYTQIKYKKEADISNPNDTPSRRKIFNDNEIVFDGKQTIVSTVNTLTTKQDRNPTSGLVLYPEHGSGKMEYRNFTPRECFRLMGFDEIDFERLQKNNFPIRTNRMLYSRERYEKLAGNSIVVDVLVPIFKQIMELKELLWSGTYLPPQKKAERKGNTVNTVLSKD